MKLLGDGKLLRIFLGESDKIDHKPLYEVIIQEARMAGATVLRAIKGFGANNRVIHTAKILRPSEDPRIVVELVETEEKIRQFLPRVDELFEQLGSGGMVTIEKAEVIRYSAGKKYAELLSRKVRSHQVQATSNEYVSLHETSSSPFEP